MAEGTSGARVGSGVGAAGAGVGTASAGGVTEAGRTGVGAGEGVGAGGGVGAGCVGAFTGAAGGSVVMVSASGASGSAVAGGLTLSMGGSELGSATGGGVESEGGVGALGSSGGSRGAARRLLNDEGIAEVAVLAWGMEKAGLAVSSGGLNTPLELTDTVPLDKSVTVESSAGLWRVAPKLNCAAPLPRPSPVPLSTKLNEAAAGLAGASLASSSPWPTRSPEKLPSVSPPMALGAWGSTLRAGVVEEGLTGSDDMLGGGVGEPVLPRAGEVDLGVKENDSSAPAPNTIFPLPPKENLPASFTGEKRRKKEAEKEREREMERNNQNDGSVHYARSAPTTPHQLAQGIICYLVSFRLLEKLR